MKRATGLSVTSVMSGVRRVAAVGLASDTLERLAVILDAHQLAIPLIALLPVAVSSLKLRAASDGAAAKSISSICSHSRLLSEASSDPGEPDVGGESHLASAEETRWGAAASGSQAGWVDWDSWITSSASANDSPDTGMPHVGYIDNLLSFFDRIPDMSGFLTLMLMSRIRSP